MVGSSGTGEGCEDWCHCGDVLESAVSADNGDGVDGESEIRSVRCHVEKVEGNGRVAFSIGVLSENFDRLENSCSAI